jgi:hypothetical protein
VHTELGVLVELLQQLVDTESIHLQQVEILQFQRNMKYIIMAILLSSCSPRKVDNNPLPIYSDMGAASDAGLAK